MRYSRIIPVILTATTVMCSEGKVTGELTDIPSAFSDQQVLIENGTSEAIRVSRAPENIFVTPIDGRGGFTPSSELTDTPPENDSVMMNIQWQGGELVEILPGQSEKFDIRIADTIQSLRGRPLSPGEYRGKLNFAVEGGESVSVSGPFKVRALKE